MSVEAMLQRFPKKEPQCEPEPKALWVHDLRREGPASYGDCRCTPMRIANSHLGTRLLMLPLTVANATSTTPR